MNKKLVIVAAVLLLILLVGGYLLLHKASLKSESALVQPTKAPSVFSSIQDALMKNMSLQCDYTAGTVHTIAYIKNGMVRSDMTDSKDTMMSGSVIMKDKKIYYWNTQKTGFMMAMPEVSGVQPTGSTPTGSNGQNTMQNLEQYKQYCHIATVADSMFVVPADVKFTDETQMMHPMIRVTGTPTGSYQQQMQQYMQQYHVTPQQ